ncbi:MAG TPA: GNAT family N-acetyltransferase [Pyrinomonadaceae bacterium]|jgi:GNAT superfamily N-acetyltransferase
MMQASSFIKEEIKIRQADDSDANALAALVAERGFDYPTEISLVRQRLSDLIRAGDCILVAVYDSKVIGMALLHRTRFLHRTPDGRIVSLVISETYRGRGVGARLIEAAESVFRSWGCGRVEVTSGAAREAAHRFYMRAGYSEQPKRFIKLL